MLVYQAWGFFAFGGWVGPGRLSEGELLFEDFLLHFVHVDLPLYFVPGQHT